MIAVVRPDQSTARQYAPDTWLVVARDGSCHIEAPGLEPFPVSAKAVLAAESSMYDFVSTEVWKAQQAAEQRQQRIDEEVRARLVAMALGVAA